MSRSLAARWNDANDPDIGMKISLRGTAPSSFNPEMLGNGRREDEHAATAPPSEGAVFRG